MLITTFFEGIIKIDVKDNNRTGFESFKETSKRRFLKLSNLNLIMKSHQKKRREFFQENIKRVRS